MQRTVADGGPGSTAHHYQAAHEWLLPVKLVSHKQREAPQRSHQKAALKISTGVLSKTVGIVQLFNGYLEPGMPTVSPVRWTLKEQLLQGKHPTMREIYSPADYLHEDACYRLSRGHHHS